MSEIVSDYLNKKKQTYFLEFTCGDHILDDIRIYEIVFNKEITYKEFLEVMQEARDYNDNYGHLLDMAFLKKHRIKYFHKVNIDYHGNLD